MLGMRRLQRLVRAMAGPGDLRYPKTAPLESLRYVVLDTELTSLDGRTNRVLSVGAIAMDGGKIRLSEQFYRVVNPGVEVPSPGVLIHGLRPMDVEQGEPMADVLAALRTFIGGAVLIGHFAKIDVRAIDKEMSALGHVLDNPAICTARVHRWLLRRKPYTEDLVRQLENTDLMSVAKAYGLDIQEAHHALDDAFVTARLWQKLLYALAAEGVKTLGGLLQIAKV